MSVIKSETNDKFRTKFLTNNDYNKVKNQSGLTLKWSQSIQFKLQTCNLWRGGESWTNSHSYRCTGYIENSISEIEGVSIDWSWDQAFSSSQ
jgi:hypothetical protein